jgi:hypothetical protein
VLAGLEPMDMMSARVYEKRQSAWEKRQRACEKRVHAWTPGAWLLYPYGFYALDRVHGH